MVLKLAVTWWVGRFELGKNYNRTVPNRFMGKLFRYSNASHKCPYERHPHLKADIISINHFSLDLILHLADIDLI